ncbi:MAG: Uma2 family endonuclease [Gemmataceae bacterium]|nr:Uma2 family endonuclease [Gemmataceae bacterium]
MSAVATPPVSVAGAASLRPLRWTVEQFHRAGDLGLFEGRRAKLIHGVIVEEGPMDPPHGDALELTDAAVRAAFGPGWRFRVQMPLVLGQSTDPLPDMVVVAGSGRGPTGAHPTAAALVVEVADSSLSYDTTTKAELYATAGIADYWVVDVDGRQLFVFRDPAPLPAGLGATAYQTRRTFGPDDTVAPLAAPEKPVKVADLLP